MKIKIKKNAHKIACRHENPSCRVRKYEDLIEKIEGQWIEVEPKFRCVSEFKTVPTPGVSELGLKIHDELVESIEDDVRLEMFYCIRCGKLSKSNDKQCCNNDKITFSDFITHETEYFMYFKNYDKMKSVSLHLKSYGKSKQSWVVSMNNVSKQSIKDDVDESKEFSSFEDAVNYFAETIKYQIIELLRQKNLPYTGTEVTVDSTSETIELTLPIGAFNQMIHELKYSSIKHIDIKTNSVKIERNVSW